MDTFAITEGIVPESSNGTDQESQNVGTRLPEGANKFQRAISAWRGVPIEHMAV